MCFMKDLFKPRTIITFALIGTFCYLAITDKISPEVIVGVCNVVLGFWFGERMGKKGGQNVGKTGSNGTPKTLG